MQTQLNGKLSLKKNDQVQVISGREKGKTGKILKVDVKNAKLLIEKINMVKRHVRPTQQNPQGGISEKEAPLHYSNVLLMCPKCNKGVRHGRKVASAEKATKTSKKGATQVTTGKKIRYCKKCETVLDQ